MKWTAPHGCHDFRLSEVTAVQPQRRRNASGTQFNLKSLRSVAVRIKSPPRQTARRFAWRFLACVILLPQLSSGANVELDSPSTPAGYVSLLLINEAAFPGERGFQSEEDSRAAMLAVLWVLHCRSSAIPSGYTQRQVAAIESRSVIDVMTAGGIKGQVDGFYKDSSGKFLAVPRVHERVKFLVGLASQGQPGKMARLLLYARDLSRQYFKAGPSGPTSPDVFANLKRVGSVPVTGRSYAWMTDVRDFEPGGTFVRIPNNNRGSLGGNRFFTLEKKR
jgi:hypothetical protein